MMSEGCLLVCVLSGHSRLSACLAQHRYAECNPSQLLSLTRLSQICAVIFSCATSECSSLCRTLTISESLPKPIASRGCTRTVEAQALLLIVDLTQAKDERAALFSAIALCTACGAHFAADTSPQQTQVHLHRSRQGPSAPESCQG